MKRRLRSQNLHGPPEDRQQSLQLSRSRKSNLSKSPRLGVNFLWSKRLPSPYMIFQVLFPVNLYFRK